MLYDSKGTIIKDQLSLELMNNAYSDINIMLEFRHPGVFIAYVKKKGGWYWGYSYKITRAISNMLKCLDTHSVVNAGGIIPVDISEEVGGFIHGETGEVIPDPLSEEMKHRHRTVIKIKLSCKDYKYIIAKIRSLSGRVYEGEGNTVMTAIKQLLLVINLSDVNIRKTLPSLESK